MSLMIVTCLSLALGFLRVRSLAVWALPGLGGLNARDIYLLQQPGVIHAALHYLMPYFAVQMLAMGVLELVLFVWAAPAAHRWGERCLKNEAKKETAIEVAK